VEFPANKYLLWEKKITETKFEGISVEILSCQILKTTYLKVEIT
jgi:hypothetical protein